ncbi:MAG: hypothetical protein GQ477_01845 [Nanohaloarchaea archaeon]|nr:hypothetical protein [Candidatus Nanohaloarchaea archaeon]
MNTFETLMMMAFGVLIAGFLMGMMVNTINVGVEVKMSTRVEHMADDLANAIQHMSSSTIDYATEVYDVGIWGTSINIVDDDTDGFHYVTVRHKDFEYSQSFHIAKDIKVQGTISDAKKLCLVKQFDSTDKKVINVMDFEVSPCNTDYKELDLRYDFDWGFDGRQIIVGELNSVPDGVDLITALPDGKIKDASFHDFDLTSGNDDKYFWLTPCERSKYFVKFDLYIPHDPISAIQNNSVNITLDVSPLNPIYVDIGYRSVRKYPDCDMVSRDYSCVVRGEDDITLIYRNGWRPNITLFNTLAMTDFYDWNFVDTKSFVNDPNYYPNDTVKMVEFHNFITPENEYVNITPVDIGRNYFSFNVVVPDDNNAVTHNNVSMTLDIDPFYSQNVNIKDGAKTISECYGGEKPCLIRVGSSVILNLEPGNYTFIIEDPKY